MDKRAWAKAGIVILPGIVGFFGGRYFGGDDLLDAAGGFFARANPCPGPVGRQKAFHRSAYVSMGSGFSALNARFS